MNFNIPNDVLQTMLAGELKPTAPPATTQFFTTAHSACPYTISCAATEAKGSESTRCLQQVPAWHCTSWMLSIPTKRTQCFYCGVFYVLLRDVRVMAQGPVGLNFTNISQVLSKSMAVVHQPQRSNNKGHFESSRVSADLMGTQLSSKQSPKNCKHCSVPTFSPLKYNSAVSLQQEFTYKENQKLVTSQFSGTLNKVSMDFKTITSKI